MIKQRWFLEIDDILLPLDKNYRIGKYENVVLFGEENKKLKLDLRLIDATLRFDAKSVPRNYAVVFAPNEYNPPFISQFYTDVPVIINNDEVDECFLRDQDTIYVRPKRSPFVVRKKEVELDERIKALVVSTNVNDDFKAGNNNVYAVQGTLYNHGAMEQNVKILKRDNAIRANIRDSLEEMVNKSSPNDLNVVYMSMHGLDNNLHIYGHDNYKSEDFFQIFNQLKGQKVLIVDACYAGSFKNGLMDDTHLLASSKPKQKSWMSETNLYMSFFTRYLLEQLNAMERLDFNKVNASKINKKLAKIKYPDGVKPQKCYIIKPKVQRSSLKDVSNEGS